MRTLALAALLVATAAAAKPPRLTVVIAVDGLGSDTLLRLRPRMKGGLAQLMSQGAYFPTARYEYSETATAAGHATLMTGANPWRHGIVSNRIVNRSTGKDEAILADPAHPVLEAPLSGDDVSPENLLAETLSDRLKLATHDKAKSIALSAKARAAITMAGRLGKAWWFNDAVGKFVTGTWYAKEFPAWARTFNEKALPQSYFGKEWPLSGAPKDYAGDDDRPFESDWWALGRAFPHPLNGGLPTPGPQFHQALGATPFMNELLVALAKAAIEGEQLGKDGVPDLLCVSFSAIDKVIHLYGPYSWEAQDALLRLDMSIGELLAAADRAAGGRQNVLIALTADHGSPGIPEELAAAGMSQAARLNGLTLHAALQKELQGRFGAELVLGIEEQDVYLNAKAIADRKLDGAAVRRAAAAWLTAHPSIAVAVAKDDLHGPVDPMGHLRAFRVGYYPERSGDVVFMPKPFVISTEEPSGTNHGTSYAYDAQVPVILAGRGVKPGLFRQEIRVNDVAPTLAALLEMGSPALSEGTIRHEALNGVK